MKKLIIASMLLSAGASAQQTSSSGVTIYGGIDAGLAYINNVGGASAVRLDTGTMSPNRLGFRGVEDLGGGFKAIFQLEHGFVTDTGAMANGSALFNRYTTVGLTGGFGSVQAGHMPDLMFEYVGKVSNGWRLTNFYLFHHGNLDNLANTFQFNNAVRYTTPDYNGFQMSAMYGAGEVTGDSSKGRNVSTGINYVKGPLRVAAAYTKSNDRLAGYAGTFLTSVGLGNAGTTFDSLTTLGAGVGYSLGRVNVNALYTQTEIQLPQRKPTQKNVDLGLSWNYAPTSTFNVGYTHNRLAAARWNQASLMHVFALSKRSQLYAQAAYQRAAGAADFAIQNNTGISSSTSQWLSSVGIHHMF
jgi:predicted porin